MTTDRLIAILDTVSLVIAALLADERATVALRNVAIRWVADPRTVVLDRSRHVLTCGDRVVELERRPTVRALLYALASSPGREVDKATLVRLGWQADYHPRVHDNTLRVNLQNLRRLIADFGMSVKFADTGYLLAVPASFLDLRQR